MPQPPLPSKRSRIVPSGVLERGRLLTLAACLVVGLVAVGGNVAHAQARQPNLKELPPKSYTLKRDFHRGDCTMFQGATWTLHRDGYAEFHGTVTSSDNNDAWLMIVTLWGQGGRNLGTLISTDGGRFRPTQFTMNLPSSSTKYQWVIKRPPLSGPAPGQTVATFNAHNFTKIVNIDINSSRC